MKNKVLKPVKLKKKSKSGFMHVLSAMPGVSDRFMSDLWTAFGHTIYVPSRYDTDTDWGTESWIVRHSRQVKHELVHVTQMERYSLPLFVFMYLGPSVFLLLGALLMSPIWTLCEEVWRNTIWLGVALLPLSTGLAWGRWRIEREAYLDQLVATEEGDRKRDAILISESLWRDYAFAWPKSLSLKWFMSELKKRPPAG